MWHFDIKGDIYSHDMRRRIFIERHDNHNGTHRFGKRKRDTTYYIVVEEWHTDEGHEDTGDFDYYTFMTFQDASVFIAGLAVKFNSPAQRVLMRAAENLATKLTKICKGGKYRSSSAEKQKPIQKEPPPPATKVPMYHVYVFDMENDTVKIGVSNAVGRRRNDIMNSSGMYISRWLYTKELSKERAFALEAECHRFFGKYRTRGEFFRISFEDAKQRLESYETVFEETSRD